MSLKNICVIGFDLDGTLYPSTPKIQKKIRKEIYEKLASIFDISIKKARNLFEENYNGNFPWSYSGSRTIEELARRYEKNLNGSDIVQESLEQADILDFIKPNLELKEMLGRLSNKYRLDLITSSTYKSTYDKLEKIGIPKAFFKFFLAEKKFGYKTDGTIYEHWLRVREIFGNQALYVGDNKKQDVQSPKRLKIKTCLISEDKTDSMADLNIKNILELEDLLK